MFRLRFYFAVGLTFLLFGCASTGGVWKGEKPNRPLQKILILLEVNAIESAKAFTSGTPTGLPATPNLKGIEQDNPLTQEISQAMQVELRRQFHSAGIAVEVKPILLRREVSQSGITTTVKTYSPTREEYFKDVEKLDQSALIVSIDRYQMRHRTEWTGILGWQYRLINPKAWIDRGETIWEFQTPVVNWSEEKCSIDKYVTCASDLTQKLVTVLRDQKIIM